MLWVRVFNIKFLKDTVFKEATDLWKAMRRKLFDVIVVLVLWIISADSNDLIIFLSLEKKQSSYSKNWHKKNGKVWICCWAEKSTWSIIGISPMALALRKQPVRTGSYSDYEIWLSTYWCSSLTWSFKLQYVWDKLPIWCIVAKTSFGKYIHLYDNAVKELGMWINKVHINKYTTK